MTIAAAARHDEPSWFAQLARRPSAAVFALAGALFVIGCLMPGDFLTSANLLNVLRAVTLLGIVVVGATFVTFGGHYVDLATPAIMAASGIVAIAALPLGLPAAIAFGVSAGALIGLINGVAVGYLRLNPIIWTLAMMSIVDGCVRLALGGRQTYPDSNNAAGRAMLDLYAATLPGGVPLTIAVLVALIALGWYVLACTRFGARVRLTGAAYEPARLSGVNVRAVVAATFVIAAMTASIGGILLTSLNQVGAAYVGAGYDFLAITAIVIGGVTLAGGRGGMAGAIGGVVVIGLLRNILTLAGVGAFGQTIVQGAVFIAVVGAAGLVSRRAGRDDA